MADNIIVPQSRLATGSGTVAATAQSDAVTAANALVPTIMALTGFIPNSITMGYNTAISDGGATPVYTYSITINYLISQQPS